MTKIVNLHKQILIRWTPRTCWPKSRCLVRNGATFELGQPISLLIVTAQFQRRHFWRISIQIRRSPIPANSGCLIATRSHQATRLRLKPAADFVVFRVQPNDSSDRFKIIALAYYSGSSGESADVSPPGPVFPLPFSRRKTATTSSMGTTNKRLSASRSTGIAFLG